jgi:hypothetical protein
MCRAGTRAIRGLQASDGQKQSCDCIKDSVILLPKDVIAVQTVFAALLGTDGVGHH